MFFIVSLISGHFSYINPKGTTELSIKSAFDNWCKFAKFKNINADWNIMNIDLNHPIQKDSYNCGIYICMFMDNFMKSDFDLNLIEINEQILINKRREINNLLLRNCDSVNSFCTNCGNRFISNDEV